LLPLKYGQEQRPQNGNVTIQIQGNVLIDSKKRVESLAQQISQEIMEAEKVVDNSVDKVVDNTANMIGNTPST
jgi:hypothetical protein